MYPVYADLLDLCDGHIVDVEPVQAAQRDLDEWRANPKDSPRPADLYRRWAKRLREVGTPAALSVLRAIQLSTTVPWNELESPDWIDRYTGVHYPKADDAAKELIQEFEELLDKPNSADNRQKVFALLDAMEDILPEWPAYLVNRLPEVYPPEMAQEAMLANLEWTGIEDEVYRLDDRGYEPPTFQESVPVNSEVMNELRDEIEVATEALRLRISSEVDRGFGKDHFEWAFSIRRAVDQSEEAEEFLGHLQDMLDRGEATQHVFLLVRPLTHNLGLTESHWARLKINDVRQNMYIWAIDFEPMLDEAPYSAPPLSHVLATDQYVRDAAERFLKEIVETLPIDGPVIRSQFFVEGFIRAQANSAPKPADEAWAFWRKKRSPAGSLAYEKIFKQTGERRKAMSAFWRKAIQVGDIAPKPKTVKAIKPSGLVLSDDRKVTWSTASKIAQEEGFENSPQLKELLQSKGWGRQLWRHL